jgi:isopropylmalate/homocitrate/citramalate synthase
MCQRATHIAGTCCADILREMYEHNPLYEHINPSLVGNASNILISELSGKNMIRLKLKEMGILDENDKQALPKP